MHTTLHRKKSSIRSTWLISDFFCTKQAIQFSDHLRSRKSEASVEVIGRAEIGSEQAMQSLMQGPPAERILVYILSLKGFDDVVDAVCEAFMPPDDTHHHSTSAAVRFSSFTRNDLILCFDSYSAQPYVDWVSATLCFGVLVYLVSIYQYYEAIQN